jgi:nucleoside-diphosphate-sugar epimerase
MPSHAGRILVTGGGGFLGRHLVDRLRGDGLRVRLLDVAARPAWADGAEVEHVRADVRDRTAVASALDGVDAVVHAAFASPHQEPSVVQSVNAGGARAVADAALDLGTRRLVLVSSTIVAKPPRTHPFLRGAAMNRLDAYRASRVAAESIVADAAGRGLGVAVVRPKTFLGPDRVGAFAILFEAVRRGGAVPLLGRGTNRYQLLDVRDFADGLARLVGADSSGVFWFGARDFATVREDLASLIDHAATGARLWPLPAPLARAMLRALEFAGLMPLSEWHYASARGEDSVVDVSRAERELGWRPARSNRRALADAYDGYVEALASSGGATTTHPVPWAHRVLGRLLRGALR